MGDELRRDFIFRHSVLLLVVIAVASGVTAAATKDEWSTTLSARIVDIDLTPSGRAVVASSDGFLTFTDEKGKTLRQESWATPAVRISSDGLKVAVGRSSSVAVIDNSGKTLWEKSLGGKITGVGMDRNAQLVAAGSDDKFVNIYDSLGSPLAHIFVEEPPTGVAVAGDRVAVGLPSGKVLLLDRTGNTLWQADAGAPVNGVDISSTSVVAATASNSVVGFSLAGEKKWSATTGSPAKAVVLSADGSLVLVVTQVGDARLFNSKGEFLLTLKSEAETYTAVAFSPGGYFAAVGSREAGVKVVQTGIAEAKPEGDAAATPTPSVTPGPTPTPRTKSWIAAVSPGPDETYIQQWGKTVIWAPQSLSPYWSLLQQDITKEPGEIVGTPGQVFAAAISPIGSTIAMVTSKGLYIVNTSGEAVTRYNLFSSIASLKVPQLEFSFSSQAGAYYLLVTGCENTGNKRVDAVYTPSDVEGIPARAPWQRWSNYLSSAVNACGPGGVRAASPFVSSEVFLSYNGQTITWSSGFQTRVRNNYTVNTSLSATATAFDLSPSGKLVAVAYGNKTVELFNDSARLAKDEQALFPVDDLRFSQDGKLIVRSGPDIFFYDPQKISLNGNMEIVRKKSVESVLAWSVRNDTFAAGTKNKEIVWIKGDAEVVNQKVGGEVNAVTLSNNGKFLAAVSKQAFKAWLFADDGRLLWETSISQPSGASVDDRGNVVVYANPSGGQAGTLHYIALPALTVVASPNGKIFVDNQEMGTTAVRILGITPGNHSVNVRAEGYAEGCTGTFPVGNRTDLICYLVAAPGTSLPSNTLNPATTASPTAAPSPIPTTAFPGATTAAPSTTSPSPAGSASQPPGAPQSGAPTPKKSPGFEALAVLAALGAAVTLRKRQA